MNSIKRRRLMMGTPDKGFIRKATQSFPITCVDCVDNDSLINMSIEGNCYQDGEPSYGNPIEIQSVGEKTANILVYPYSHTTKTENGITFTDNGDGSITANGTATGNAYFQFTAGAGGRAFIKAGTYIISGNPSSTCGMSLYLYENQTDSYISIIAVNNGATKVFTIEKDMYYYWYISIKSGTTVDNITFSPRLINIQENNIFPEMTLTASTNNGITFTNVGNNTVTVNGTFTGTASSVNLSHNFDFEPGKNYLLYNNSNSTVTFGVKYFDENGTVKYLVSQPQNSKSFTWVENWTFSSLYLQMSGTIGTSVDETINPMLIQTDYEPYGYKIPIVAETENLFDLSLVNKDLRDTLYSASGVSSWGGGVMLTNNVHTIIRPGKTYTLSYDMECLKLYDGDTASVTTGLSVHSATLGHIFSQAYLRRRMTIGEKVHISVTATIPDNFDEVVATMLLYTGYYKDDAGNIIPADTIRFTNIKIEEEVHESEPIVSNVYLKEPLRGVKGDFIVGASDVLDIKNRICARNLKEGAVSITSVTTATTGRVIGIIYTSSIGKMVEKDAGVISEKAVQVKYNATKYEGSLYENPTNICFTGSADDTLETLKAKYDGSKIVYILAEPITEKIIAPNLPTFKHGTTYSIATTVQPLSGTVEYYSTTKGV